MSILSHQSKHRLPLKTLLFVGLLCFLVALFTAKNIAGGFICGAVAFCFSAIGLERLARRILRLGDVVQGVRSGIFWVFFKFLAPASLIFLGLSRGFSAAAVVSGIVGGLTVFCTILWFEGK